MEKKIKNNIYNIHYALLFLSPKHKMKQPNKKKRKEKKMKYQYNIQLSSNISFLIAR